MPGFFWLVLSYLSIATVAVTLLCWLIGVEIFVWPVLLIAFLIGGLSAIIALPNADQSGKETYDKLSNWALWLTLGGGLLFAIYSAVALYVAFRPK